MGGEGEEEAPFKSGYVPTPKKTESTKTYVIILLSYICSSHSPPHLDNSFMSNKYIHNASQSTDYFMHT